MVFGVVCTDVSIFSKIDVTSLVWPYDNFCACHIHVLNSWFCIPYCYYKGYKGYDRVFVPSVSSVIFLVQVHYLSIHMVQ